MLIKIFGGKSEGKSTIAYLLNQILKEKGFEVQIDGELIEPERFNENLVIMQEAQAQGDHLKIEIKEINYARETLPQYARDYNHHLK